MLEFLLIDLDDTILDFKKAEKLALSKTLQHFGMEPTQAVCARYSQINRAHWQMLERGEITRAQVLLGRFERLFAELGVEADPAAIAADYEHNLSIGHFFLPGAEAALERLHGKYKLYLASNGTAKVQAGRLESANIRRYFEEVFISQLLRADKPSPEFFDKCFARIPGFVKEKAMMVGDSLTSDMLGGKNAGIATCWVNPEHKKAPESLQPDYTIERLEQLPVLLEGI
ncbi:MAG TPA: noncanonical pyrimidine nucleotidase, YjjG family [Candidatus Faecousia intestinigallinarum]|nr:noncanonical pyrimidine nucleotidase, YjjG family [Candidatus Faecousia intestinigallinarum]